MIDTSTTEGKIASQNTIDWNKLDIPHKEFIMRAHASNGCKRWCKPHYHYENDEVEGTALWKKAEQSGFIECVGSFKWRSTEKFNALKNELFGINVKWDGKE